MKGLIVIIIIIAIAVVGFFMLRDGSGVDINTQNDSVTQEQTVEGSDSKDTLVESDDSTIDTTGEIIVVTYSDEGFSPKEINVAQGQTVRFVNESSGNMWVGSAMHPDHVVYSDTKLKEHCPDVEGVAFDQCETGDMYEFIFMKDGEWGYHNHVKPSDFGKVIVK